MRRQAGFYLFAAVALLLLFFGLLAFSKYRSSTNRVGAQDISTKDQFAKVSDALVNFVNANGYLPCPASGASATGLADPTGASATCNSPAGVVPWATVGLTANDATDAYASKISYRVYSGTTGLTQADGASMVNCDLVRAAVPVPQPAGAAATTQLCRTDHDTSPAQFLAGKGLALTDGGTSVSGVAFILISHGPNQVGAYRMDGTQATVPNVASSEYGNTQANGPFVNGPANTVGLNTTDIAYFDDSAAFLTISDLAGRAKVAARDWPDPSGLALTAASIQSAAVAAGATPVNNSTGTSTLTLAGNITVTASGTGGRDISTRTGTSGYGIGAIATGTTTTGSSISTSGGEALTFLFPTTGQKFALMLVDFGSSFGQFEQAQLVFKNGATTVQTSTLTACNAGSVLASYSISVSAPYDTVEVLALNRVGSTSSSSFLIGGLLQCQASATSCTVSNATPATACP